jgi:antitoxin VapB
MPLNIKNADVERLVEEVARLTGESKTECIRQALLERRGRLRERVTVQARRTRLESFLEREIWAKVPPGQAGSAPDRAERERILGYGADGV